jgi:hypothetical protein
LSGRLFRHFADGLDRFDSEGFYFSDRLDSITFLAAMNCNVCTRLCQRDRDRLADARRRTGHERSFTRKAKCVEDHFVGTACGSGRLFDFICIC